MLGRRLKRLNAREYEGKTKGDRNMRFLKRLLCEHRIEYAGTWTNTGTIGIGKYERPLHHTEIVACCVKCGKILRFDTREEFEVRKAVGEIRNKNAK